MGSFGASKIMNCMAQILYIWEWIKLGIGRPRLASFWNDFIYLFFLFFKESKWHSPNNTMKMFQGK